MFVITRDASAAMRVIATLLAIALVMWTLGSYTFAEAANITDVRDLLSDSAPGANSDHTIDFAMSATGAVASGGGTIVVTFPAGFNLTGVVAGDIDLEVNGADVDITGTAWSVAVGASTITFTSVAGSVAAGQTVSVEVGTVAAGGTNQINNPTTPAGGNESYEIAISAGTDNGYTRVVVLDTVLVTAQVNTTFDFTVTGLGTGVAVNGTTTNITTSSTSIPFGVLTAYAPKTGAQDLQVRTNAGNGFAVTVEADGALRSSTGADIDGFIDGSYVATPNAWQSPLNGLNILDENTWGHWGITTEDDDTGIAGGETLFNGNEVLSNEFMGVSTTPLTIFAHNGPADNTTPDVGSTTVGYQVEISPLQEAADDYQTTLTYIATPTF